MPISKTTSSHSSTILPKTGSKLAMLNAQPSVVMSQTYGTMISIPSESNHFSIHLDPEVFHLSSEQDSDSMDTSPTPSRKRQRLDHLTHEEKIMRRKLKNRVAAQCARDRKKARMTELEEQVAELQTERNILLAENAKLKLKNVQIENQNVELRKRLGLAEQGEIDNAITVEQEEVQVTPKESEVVEMMVEVEGRSVEHAEGTGSAATYTLDDAIRLLACNNETDDLLDMLQQCSEDLLECDLSLPIPENTGEREPEPSCNKMVGSTSKELESIKELIQFDHIYYKQDNSCLSDNVLQTKDLNNQAVSLKSEVSAKDSISTTSVEFLNPVSVALKPTKEIPMINITDAESTFQSSGKDSEESVFHPNNFLTVPSEVVVCLTDPLSVDVCGNESSGSPSPSISDAGYDSSFSASSPSSDIHYSGSLADDDDAWDETFTELFPSLA